MIAKQQGYHATFMPKPFKDKDGCGMHINYSLYDSTTDENLFYDEENDYLLSTLGYQCIAGSLTHAEECTLIFNPTINSYKRLNDSAKFAPHYICWGNKNRTALIRIPEIIAPQAARIEIRSPDALCDPYHTFALLIASALDGIENEIELPEETKEYAHNLSDKQRKARGIEELPQTLFHALIAAQKTSFLEKILGKKITDLYVDIKQGDCERFHQEITRWERKKYL